MRQIFFLFIISSIFCQSNFATTLDPNKITSMRSSWYERGGAYKGEHYYDYMVEGKVVFRILDRCRPAIE